MKNFFTFITFAVCLSAIYCYTSYENYKVYQVTPRADQYEALANWQYQEGVDFWKLYTAEYTSTVMIAPEKQKSFEMFLSNMNITNKVVIDNLEPIIEEERQSMARNRRGKSTVLPGMTPDFSVFWSAAEMQQYCEFLASTYPQFVTIETMVFSPGGRRIYAMKVSSGTFGQKPIVAMESGMHAREWVCPPTVLYLLHRLIQTPDSRNELLRDVDWLIVPMQNPDGYEWSRTNNRMWRQNRRQVNPTCIGVDLNRNNGYSWRSPTVSCGSLTFPGFAPLSEPESFALDQLLARYASNIKLYLSVHSFGDMILWPWGYSGSPGWISTHAEHRAAGELWRNGILAVGGRNYINGNVADVLGNAFGAIDDHAAGQYNIPLVYTLELTSGFNFVYPEERIEALVLETFWGYRALALHIGQTFGRK